MKNDVLLKLLEDLPDDLIESAAEPEQSRRPVFLRYAVPAIAACMVIVLAAVIYPKLRTVTPERTEESSFTTAVTTAQPAETVITGNVPETVQTGTEAAPDPVHIVTAPAYSAVTGKPVTAAPGETLPENDPQNTEEGGGQDDPGTPQDNGTKPQENAATRPGARTTSPSSTARQRTYTTAKPVTTRPVPQTAAATTRVRPVTETECPAPTRQTTQALTDTPSSYTQEAWLQTQASPIKENPGEDGPEKGDTQTPTAPTTPTEQRILCPCSLNRPGSGSDNAPTPGNSNDPPVMGNESPAAELRGNRLTVHTDGPCSDAMIAYLALRDHRLIIEIYYDRNDRSDLAEQEFTVYLPWEYANEVWAIESVCYEVDNVDEFDHSNEEVTLIVLP